MDFDKQLEAMRRRHVLHIDDDTESSDNWDESSEVPQQSTSLPEPMQGDVFFYQSNDHNTTV